MTTLRARVIVWLRAGAPDDAVLLADILASGDRSLAPLMRQAGQPSSVVAALKAPRPLAPAEAEAAHFEPLGGGRIGVGHRPRLKSLPRLQGAGLTHVLTLLSREEGAHEIGRSVEAAGMTWIWFPLPNGDPLPPSRDGEVRALFQRLTGILASGATILVHCSAGIHRTGMITAGLLASLQAAEPMGVSPERLGAELLRLRQVTGEGVGAARLAWSLRFAD